MNKTELQDFYHKMYLIRCVETKILALFSEGKVGGTTHTCIGQEANAVGLIDQLNNKTDYVISNHRNHGHFLSFGGTPKELISELLGKTDGVSGGIGGSQHIKKGNFISNGIQGGGAPVGCGLAMGCKLKGEGGVVVVCIGDGTLGEGAVYESLNMASLWELPIIFLVENNNISQTTPTNVGVAGDMEMRGAAFGLKTFRLESTDILEIREWGNNLIEIAKNGKPVWAIIDTIRLGPHSKGDDTRSVEELKLLKERDPLFLACQKLDKKDINLIENKVNSEIEKLLKELNV
jgi:TPP-dependent pyruvate/acetoin dehydrogenase alpha subunit